MNNPIRYTDPSGRCIFTGVDTAACIIALAVGIPAIAAATTAAWNYAVNQGGGLGGANWGHPECIDWGQVANAGGSGGIAALEKLLSIPLAPDYLFAMLMGKSPTEANATLLSYVGLKDQYLALQGNPYYVAGGYGGQAAVIYISSASFIKGLPSIYIVGPGSQFSGYNTLTLSGYSVTAVGGNGTLVYVGAAGLTPQFSTMSGAGGDRGFDQILNNDELFKDFVFRKHPANRPYPADISEKIYLKLRGLGYSPRIDPPDGIWPWHINLERYNVHIPITPWW